MTRVIRLYPALRDPAYWYPDEQPGWHSPCWVCGATVEVTETSGRCRYCCWVVCARCGACAKPETVEHETIEDLKQIIGICPCGVLASGLWAVQHGEQLERHREALTRNAALILRDRVEWRCESGVASGMFMSEHRVDPENPEFVVRTDDNRLEVVSRRQLLAVVGVDPLDRAARAMGRCEAHRESPE